MQGRIKTGAVAVVEQNLWSTDASCLARALSSVDVASGSGQV